MVRDYLDRALLDLATLYRYVLLVQYNLYNALINSDLTQQLNELAQSVKPEQALKVIQVILKTRQSLAQNTAPLLQIEALMVELVK